MCATQQSLRCVLVCIVVSQVYCCGVDGIGQVLGCRSRQGEGGGCATAAGEGCDGWATATATMSVSTPTDTKPWPNCHGCVSIGIGARPADATGCRERAYMYLTGGGAPAGTA